MANDTSSGSGIPDGTFPTSGNPFAPQEPPELIFLEKADFVGMHLSDMLYGISAVLFFQCMSALIWPMKGRKRNIPLAIYTFLLFGLGTVFMGMNIHMAQLGFIDDRDFPGGPETYVLSRYSSALVVIPNASFILANWLADGLLLYRCNVIWQNVIWQGTHWILVFPIIMYLASIAMGIMTIFQSSRPDASLWTSVTVNFGLPYFSISAALNILLTLLISTRLLFHQRRLRRTGITVSHGLPYSPIISMLVESSAIYAISSILFISTYGANNNISALFLPIVAQTQIIAPLMIISRVARQRAWSATSTGSYSSSVPNTGSVAGISHNTTSHTQSDDVPMTDYSPKRLDFKGGNATEKYGSLA